MSSSLKKLSGSKLKLFLEKTTNTPLKGILTGILLTVLVQSSSATSGLVVSLVRAGLMTLPQAVGVILGSNIGTTSTSILMSLNIGRFALPMIFIGMILFSFFKKQFTKQLGGVIIGFGMLFLGLNTMNTSLDTLAQLPKVTHFLQVVGNRPLLGVLVGTLITALIQSSGALIGILQQLYNTGSIPIMGAVAIVLGSNIGTTITSIIASLGGSSSAKRTALVHVMFNFIGSIIFLIFLRPYIALIKLISNWMGIDYLTSKFTISIAHVLFNVISVLIFYWFINQLVWLVSKIIPSKDELQIDKVYLDKVLLKTSPDLALENAKAALKQMANITVEMYKIVAETFFDYDESKYELAEQLEDQIDNLDYEIHEYLVSIGTNELNNKQIKLLSKHIDTTGDLERVGDHLDNLLEIAKERYELGIKMNETVREELIGLFIYTENMMKKTYEAYFNDNLRLALEIEHEERMLDGIIKDYRHNFVLRISDSQNRDIDGNRGFYVDILSNIERSGDHCNNMALNTADKKFGKKMEFFQSKR